MPKIVAHANLDRRAFLKSATVCGGALLAGGGLPFAGLAQNATPAASNAKWRNQIGLELYTIGNLMRGPAEYEAALVRISEMGYREIEPAGGYNNLEPKAFRAMLDKYKLSMPSTHSGASRGPDMERQLEGFQIMGIQYTELGGGGAGGGGRGGPAIPGLTAEQQSAVPGLNGSPELMQAANNARAAFNTAVFAAPQNPSDVQSKLEALNKAEAALALGRAEALDRLQSSANKLNPEQLASLRAAMQPPPPPGRGGGRGPGGPGGGGGGNTLEAVKRQAEQHNANGALVKKFGMKILIHNHTQEFARLEDGKTTQHDAMAANIDPELVTMQLDIGWASVAGQDIVSLFKKHPGRYELWHVKDAVGIKGLEPDTNGARPPGARLVPVGEGEVDYKTIFGYAELAGMRHFCVEQDGARGMEDVQTSYNNLTAKILV